MLWKCICLGLAILAHWQTYAAALLFLSLSTGSKYLSDVLNVSSSRKGSRIRFVSRLLLTLGQVAGISVFVNIMCPIMLGFSSHAAWSWPPLGLATNWDVVMSFAQLVIVATVVSRIPILGQSPSVLVFVIGSLALVPILDILGGHMSALGAHAIRLWPGCWFMTAILVIGAALTWLGTMFVVIPSVVLEGHAKRIGTLFVYPFAAAFGFIPLYIYCAWLRQQIGTF